MFARLSPAALRVFLFMLRLCNARQECWPSQRVMAQRCGISERAVRYALTQLRSGGLVQVLRRGSSGRSSLYRVAADGNDRESTRQAVAAGGGSCLPHEAAAHCRELRQPVAGACGNALPPTHTQDSDTALTPSRRDAASAMCAADAARERGATDAQADADDDDDADDAEDAVALADSHAGADLDADREVVGRQASGAAGHAGGPPPDRAQRMLALGIDDTMALQLLQHLPSRIDCALDNAAFLAARGRLVNGAGYVIEALRCNYPPLPERLEAERRENSARRARASQADREQREARQRQEESRSAAEAEARTRAFIDALEPEAREELKQRTLATLPSSVRAALAAGDPLRSRNLASLMHAHAAESTLPQN